MKSLAMQDLHNLILETSFKLHSPKGSRNLERIFEMVVAGGSTFRNNKNNNIAHFSCRT